MTAYQPPFELNHAMLSKVALICEWLGRWKQANQDGLAVQLRRSNRIRSIQASLAIEANTLSIDQMTAVLDGKLVLGSPREIQEVRNAFAAYEALPDWRPEVLDDLLAAHSLLLRGLADDAGRLRQGGVGIYQGQRLVHMAPPASQVPRLMEGLLTWLAATDAHPLIASCALHYEIEFVHPFSDGNGRIGRLWQTLVLYRWQPILAYLPVETLVKSRQADYYRVLGESDQAANCSSFIMFMLDAITQALQHAIKPPANERDVVETPVEIPETRVEIPETRVETRVKTPEQVLKLLLEQPTLSLAELADLLGKSISAVERAVAKLRAQGCLSYVGPKKGGHWRVGP